MPTPQENMDAMTMQENEEVSWFTVFRMKRNDDWLYNEIRHGRLRQGWGAHGLALAQSDGEQVNKRQWEAAYREVGWGDLGPNSKRYAILTRMLQLDAGCIVVVPKMPTPNRFTIARVNDKYRFELADDRKDFGHIIPVDPKNIRVFNYRADDDAFLVSGLFSRANHRPAVTFCASTKHVEAMLRLLKRESRQTAKSENELFQAPVDQAFKAAARSLQDQIKTWDGGRFEKAVRHAFREQGYQVKDGHRHYDRQGGDADIVALPPARYGFFQPEEIAVQVKWKQCVDTHDRNAVKQIIKWAASQESNAAKYVISSASRFTEKAKELAIENDVVLIGGLQTMCFLLGVPERYREDWEFEA